MMKKCGLVVFILFLYLGSGLLVAHFKPFPLLVEDNDAEHEIYKPTVLGWFYYPCIFIYESLFLSGEVESGFDDV